MTFWKPFGCGLGQQKDDVLSDGVHVVVHPREAPLYVSLKFYFKKKGCSRCKDSKENHTLPLSSLCWWERHIFPVWKATTLPNAGKSDDLISVCRQAELHVLLLPRIDLWKATSTIFWFSRVHFGDVLSRLKWKTFALCVFWFRVSFQNVLNMAECLEHSSCPPKRVRIQIVVYTPSPLTCDHDQRTTSLKQAAFSPLMLCPLHGSHCTLAANDFGLVAKPLLSIPAHSISHWTIHLFGVDNEAASFPGRK